MCVDWWYNGKEAHDSEPYYNFSKKKVQVI